MGRSPGFQWWQKRGKQEEGGAWRDTRAALSGPSKPPPPCPPGSAGRLFLPEMPRIPRPRAAQRPRSAWRSPGEGPGIAAAAGEGRTQEARGARVMESRAGRTAQRSGWSVGVAELRPGIGLNVGNLVSKEGAVAEVVMRGELPGGEHAPGCSRLRAD